MLDRFPCLTVFGLQIFCPSWRQHVRSGSKARQSMFSVSHIDITLGSIAYLEINSCFILRCWHFNYRFLACLIPPRIICKCLETDLGAHANKKYTLPQYHYEYFILKYHPRIFLQNISTTTFVLTKTDKCFM